MFWTANREDGRHRGMSRAPPIRIQHHSPENHEREEKKKREKHKNTKTGEIHVSEEIKKATTQTAQTDHVPEHGGGGSAHSGDSL